MTKVINHGFTDVFGDAATPVELLRYDNDKYVKVRLPSGEEEDLKSGYIYADAKLTRRIADVNWFILGGGKRRDYKPRTSHTYYDVAVSGKRLKFDSKDRAVRAVMRLAKSLNEEIEIWSVSRRQTSFSMGEVTIACSPDGTAMQHDHHQKMAKFRRGFGKLKGPVPRTKAW